MTLLLPLLAALAPHPGPNAAPLPEPSAVEQRAAEDDHRWEVHDMERPWPERVEGARAVTTPPPADAIVLMGMPGAADSDRAPAQPKGLGMWQHGDGRAAEWQRLDDGSFQVKAGSGDIQTRASFGDVQLHLEWFCPESEAENEGQGRGNSGLFLQSQYEIQVLESVGSQTYADGMAASIYGQRPPLVNPGAGIGAWNSYDVVYRAPRFDDEGALLKPATVTVLHNGVLVQDHVAFEGPTRHHARTQYEAHAPKLPLRLQDHGDPVRFRNMWLREL
ncbi:MAG: DUF1080 domain-containing protein [Planctomycetota bacterium]|nr:DUF1080 domain-containing protein [Planctomycetota bacterium]